jgi:hypothetical protein
MQFGAGQYLNILEPLGQELHKRPAAALGTVLADRLEADFAAIGAGS